MDISIDSMYVRKVDLINYTSENSYEFTYTSENSYELTYTSENSYELTIYFRK